jgi:FtsP/CotA-like multicopper oxidase with cupredoxin domain
VGRAGITVCNRLREPTTVHWHGIELESLVDGVSGEERAPIMVVTRG